MKKKQILASELNGFFIYHTSDGRTVYSNPFMSNGYIISNRDIRDYSRYSLRLLASVLIILLITLVDENRFFLGVLLGAAFYLVTSFLFYQRFLPHLSQIKHFQKPKKDGYIKIIAKTRSVSSILIFTILCIILGILILFNATKNAYSGFLFIANCILSGIAFLFAILNIISIIQKRKLQD